MGTRSDIIVQRSDGKWCRIYCHWNGYLDHNGKILFEHYTSQQAAEALIALGSLSALGPKIGIKHPFEAPPAYKEGAGPLADNPAYLAYKRKYGGMCKAYGRDRGEADSAAQVGDTLQAVWPEEDTWTEFTYVWKDGKWFVCSADEGTQALRDLGVALLGQACSDVENQMKR